MKNFWPQRPLAKGFSIERLARKYRDKLSINSRDVNSDQLLNNLDLPSRTDKKTEILQTPFLFNKRHWANRDFSEYIDAA